MIKESGQPKQPFLFYALDQDTPFFPEKDGTSPENPLEPRSGQSIDSILRSLQTFPSAEYAPTGVIYFNFSGGTYRFDRNASTLEPVGPNEFGDNSAVLEVFAELKAAGFPPPGAKLRRMPARPSADAAFFMDEQSDGSSPDKPLEPRSGESIKNILRSLKTFPSPETAPTGIIYFLFSGIVFRFDRNELKLETVNPFAKGSQIEAAMEALEEIRGSEKI